MFYWLFKEHFDEFALVHEERFARKDGSHWPVVRRVVDSFPDCGRPENGSARVRYPDCRAE